MRIIARLLALGLAGSLTLAACSSGSTEVEGVTGGGSTGTTGETGPTGQTAVTGPTSPTRTTGGGEFGGPVSIDTSVQAAAGIQAAFYSCNGLEGTWTYTVQGGPPPIDFDIETTVDMGGGEGTLVISDEFEIPQLGTIAFTDTVDLVIAGTPDTPTFKATAISVEVQGSLPGLDQIAESFFQKDAEVSILAGAEQC